jgi:hypothetical protein
MQFLLSPEQVIMQLTVSRPIGISDVVNIPAITSVIHTFDDSSIDSLPNQATRSIQDVLST